MVGKCPLLEGRKMLARSTVPSLIVIGTLHMLTLACASDAALAANSKATDSAAVSGATFPIAAGNTHAPALQRTTLILNPSRWRPVRRSGAYRPRVDRAL